eukprot:scaffold89066_cov31-Tisochrysis_lutea.AAC.2
MARRVAALSLALSSTMPKSNASLSSGGNSLCSCSSSSSSISSRRSPIAPASPCSTAIPRRVAPRWWQRARSVRRVKSPPASAIASCAGASVSRSTDVHTEDAFGNEEGEREEGEEEGDEEEDDKSSSSAGKASSSIDEGAAARSGRSASGEVEERGDAVEERRASRSSAESTGTSGAPPSSRLVAQPAGPAVVRRRTHACAPDSSSCCTLETHEPAPAPAPRSPQQSRRATKAPLDAPRIPSLFTVLL